MSLDPRNNSVAHLLEQGRQTLLATSASPDLDAALLLAQVLKCERLDLMREPERSLSTDQVHLYLTLLERRKNHEPLAYILGHKEFYGYKFKITSAVLCPRPETEILVELAIQSIAKLKQPISVLDLGTGSGCIVVSLALELQKLGCDYQALAIDQSEAALQIAKENATTLRAINVSFKTSDWFDGIATNQKFNLIVSNPPYVKPGKGISPELEFEPARALYAGNDGLAAVQAILDYLFDYLEFPGLFICEIGDDQGVALKDYAEQIVKRKGLSASVSVRKDLAGRERVLAVSYGLI